MTLRSRVVALATTLPLLVGVAGCADDAAIKPTTGTTKPAVVPAKAAAPPARLTLASFPAAMNGANAKATSVESIVRINSAGEVLTMRMAQTYQPVAMKWDMSSPALGGSAHIVLVGGTLYVSSPKAAPAGKYVKVRLKNNKNPALAELAEMAEGADPVKSLKLLSKGLRKVKFVKSETLGFRTVDRYQVTVDTNAGLGLEKTPAGLPKTTVYTLWLGADRLVYKMAFKLGAMDMQVTTSGYNTVGRITAPPAGKIYTR